MQCVLPVVHTFYAMAFVFQDGGEDFYGVLSSSQMRMRSARQCALGGPVQASGCGVAGRRVVARSKLRTEFHNRVEVTELASWLRVQVAR